MLGNADLGAGLGIIMDDIVLVLVLTFLCVGRGRPRGGFGPHDGRYWAEGEHALVLVPTFLCVGRCRPRGGFGPHNGRYWAGRGHALVLLVLVLLLIDLKNKQK